MADETKIVSYLSETYEEYKKLNKNRNEKLLKIYSSFSTYEEEKVADWQTTFKVNKAHEIVERVLPRIIAKNPRWIVSPKLNDFYPETTLPVVDPVLKEQVDAMDMNNVQPEQEAIIQQYTEQAKAYNSELEKKKKKTTEMSRAVQDYLEYIFDEYNYEDYIRSFAKNGVVYGKSWAKISYKYETVRNVKETEKDDKFEKEIVEEVIGEYPILEIKSWTEVLGDPRYKKVDDMPCFFEITSGVRLSQLKKKKDLINLDKLTNICGIDNKLSDDDWKKKVQQVAQINTITAKTPVDKNSLTVITAWAYYEEEKENKEEEKEKFYEFQYIDELNLLIKMKEVTKNPFVEFNVFEDTDTNFSIGFVEPILGLQDELNFQKNSAVNFINQALNRTFIWSPNSNIDPRDIISKPFGIIPTTGDVPNAMANLQELPFRQLPSDYFNFQNDIERQIQGQTFTVDTTNQKGQQALTDTATGARIEFYEANVVLDQVRKNFEQALQKLAYKLLQEAFENMEDNIVIKKLGSEDWFDVNKEYIKDAIKRYSIKIETGSSTYDDVVNRRQDAMAFWNVLKQAQEAGMNINLKSGVEDIAATFEKKDLSKYFTNTINMAEAVGKIPKIPNSQMPADPQTPESLTQQVTGGQI